MAVIDDAAAMDLALGAAREAAARGDVPVGAVVLRAGEVIAVAANRREADADPTAHAEILVLRQAADLLGSWRLEGCELVVTLEPCAMCAGALIAARVSRRRHRRPWTTRPGRWAPATTC